MGATQKCRFLCRIGEVSKARERWIFIECVAFGFACEYLVKIRDCKMMVVALEGIRARGNIIEVKGPC